MQIFSNTDIDIFINFIRLQRDNVIGKPRAYKQLQFQEASQGEKGVGKLAHCIETDRETVGRQRVRDVKRQTGI